MTAITVGQLIQCLRTFSEDLPVVAEYDSRCAGGIVVKLELGSGTDDSRESVVLVVE